VLGPDRVMIQATGFISGKFEHCFSARGEANITKNDTISTADNKLNTRTNLIDPDMGCTLPFFPGDVRDSMCSPSGGSGTPIHPHSVTLSHIHQHYEYVVASTASGLACAVLR